MKFSALLKAFIFCLLFTPFVSCEKVQETQNNVQTAVTVVLDVDEVSLESISVRVRHDGDAGLLWVYLLTQDQSTHAEELLSEKLMLKKEHFSKAE